MNEQTINRTQEVGNVGSGGGIWLLMPLITIAAAIAGPLLLGKPGVLVIILMAILTVLILCGFYTIQPNQAVAIILFGNYKGTDRTTGLRWVPFWYGRKKVSLRVRNVTSEALKVNDQRGNPIEIAANVVWRVQDTARALFDVDDYTAFVNIQIETALRETARQYAYDHGEEGEPTLRDDAEIVGERLKRDLQARIDVAGIAIDETHLMHLAYAPEIAGSMLKRQQAEAVIAARQKIVAGAVGMVEQALEQLSTRGVVDLDEERKAAMVSNLLVVLCADREAQPVVNTGTLYG
ncbi:MULTISPECIES: SPFH domain-containing protein [Asticcacaulis]|uniref:SPFH domain-containing protein n=1 Tax=Asticcacaulis TaxID=76890 RepID=UPI002858D741|nr:SPFH domain-containing protein [Asticcacaulis sp. BE141]MBP2157604.1 regulator of protease activity HflC (stomatin/prohibitin superfamily) [Asticcacaulis solisilvae]MDR6798649.1 regulator of protease activity HflC (stomatin/prohibitin superfamily) [Asticcacaulis sp. BE141]